MLTIKEQAEINRIGLLTGLLSQRETACWADHIIQSNPQPDYAIIEVSLLAGSNLPACLLTLREMGGQPNTPSVARALLGLCARKLQSGHLTPDEAADILGQLAPDVSCRRCSIKPEYEIKLDQETVQQIRSLQSSPNVANAAADFLAPYAADADDIWECFKS